MKDGCERCGCELPYWMERSGVSRSFCGVYFTCCNGCKSDIDLFTKSSPEWKRYLELDAFIKVAFARAETDKTVAEAIIPYREEQLQIELKLHPQLRAFIEAGKPATV